MHVFQGKKKKQFNHSDTDTVFRFFGSDFLIISPPGGFPHHAVKFMDVTKIVCDCAIVKGVKKNGLGDRGNKGYSAKCSK